jgi:ribosome-binding factor A
MKQRTERLAMDIQAALGDLLARGEVKDPRVRNTPLITITQVRVTGDLREARVGFTVFGADEPSLERVCQGLTAAKSHLQHELARRLRTRSTPLLTFEIDRSLEQAFEMNRLLREVNAAGTASPTSSGEAAVAPQAEGADEDADHVADGDDDDDDPHAAATPRVSRQP